MTLASLIWTRIKRKYKVYSFLKQCCARSSFVQNKVLHLMSAEEGFVKVPCFAQMKIAQTLFKNEWTLTRTLLYVVYVR